LICLQIAKADDWENTTLGKCRVLNIATIELIVDLQTAFGSAGGDSTDDITRFMLSGEFGLPRFFSNIVAPILDEMALDDEHYRSHIASVRTICETLTKKM